MARAAAPLQGRQPGRCSPTPRPATSACSCPQDTGVRTGQNAKGRYVIVARRPTLVYTYDTDTIIAHVVSWGTPTRGRLGPRRHHPLPVHRPRHLSGRQRSARLTPSPAGAPMRAVPGGSLLLLEDRSSRTCLSSRRSGGERTTCLGQPSGAAATPPCPALCPIRPTAPVSGIGPRTADPPDRTVRGALMSPQPNAALAPLTSRFPALAGRPQLRGPSVSEAPRSALRECRDWGLGEYETTGLRCRQPLDLSTSRTAGLPNSARSATREPRTESVGLRIIALSCQRTTEPSDCRTLEKFGLTGVTDLQAPRTHTGAAPFLVYRTPRVRACGSNGPTHFARLALRDYQSPELSHSRTGELTDRKAGRLPEPGSSADR